MITSRLCTHIGFCVWVIVDIGWLPMGLYLAWCIMNGINRMGRPMCKLLFMSIFSENHVHSCSCYTYGNLLVFPNPIKTLWHLYALQCKFAMPWIMYEFDFEYLSMGLLMSCQSNTTTTTTRQNIAIYIDNIELWRFAYLICRVFYYRP